MLYAVDQVQLQTQKQAQNRNTETAYCGWCARTVQPLLPAVREETSWDAIHETNELDNSSGRKREQFNHHDQLSSQFASKAQDGPSPALMKAKVPWSARRLRGNLSEKVGVLKTVKGILNKLTVEKFDLLMWQLLNSGITSAGILKDVVSLIFERAISEPTFCPIYAQLCYEVGENLPSFPAEEPGGGMITFKRVLLNNCQETFECADQPMKRRDKERIFKLRTLGNIRLIGELRKRWMLPDRIGHCVAKELLGSDRKACPDKEHIETICQFFSTIGKQLDESPRSRQINDTYFIKIKELVANPQLTPRLKFMVCNLIDLRSNNWVPRHAEGARFEVSVGARGEIERPSFRLDESSVRLVRTAEGERLDSEVDRVAREAQVRETSKPNSEYMMMTRMVMLFSELLKVGNEMLTLLKLAVAVLIAIMLLCVVGVMKM